MRGEDIKNSIDTYAYSMYYIFIPPLGGVLNLRGELCFLKKNQVI